MAVRSTATTGLVAFAAAVGVALAQAAVPTAPRPFALVIEGRHEPAADSPTGLRHEGRFVASGAFCPSGDVTTPGEQQRRLLTCADGTGSATVLIDPVDAEDRGAGEWQIVAGTGTHAELRGRGTFRSIRTAGDPSDHASITFRSSWAGVADRDDRAPTVAFTRTSVVRLVRPRHAYVLRLAWSLHDAPGNGLGYRVAVTANGLFLASRVGVTHSGMVTADLRLRAAAEVRTLRVAIRAVDPFGNERVIARDVQLPR